MHSSISGCCSDGGETDANKFAQALGWENSKSLLGSRVSDYSQRGFETVVSVEGNWSLSGVHSFDSVCLTVPTASKYKVTVFTGNKKGAGTDANVYITMFGEFGDSGEKKLNSRKNNFERGK